MSEGNQRTIPCAACKHRKKSCGQGCLLRRYFPAEQKEDFLAVHRLFGVKRILKLLGRLENDEQRSRACESMIWEAKQWRDDPLRPPLYVHNSLQTQVDAMTKILKPLLQPPLPLLEEVLTGLRENGNPLNHGGDPAAPFSGAENTHNGGVQDNHGSINMTTSDMDVNGIYHTNPIEQGGGGGAAVHYSATMQGVSGNFAPPGGLQPTLQHSHGARQIPATFNNHGAMQNQGRSHLQHQHHHGRRGAAPYNNGKTSASHGARQIPATFDNHWAMQSRGRFRVQHEHHRLGRGASLYTNGETSGNHGARQIPAAPNNNGAMARQNQGRVLRHQHQHQHHRRASPYDINNGGGHGRGIPVSDIGGTSSTRHPPPSPPSSSCSSSSPPGMEVVRSADKEENI